MKKNQILFVLLMSLATLLFAQKVSGVYDSDFDFSGPKTYDWSAATQKKMKRFVNVPYGSKEIIKYFKEYGYEINEDIPELIVDIEVEESKTVNTKRNSTVSRAGVRTRRNPTGAIRTNTYTPVRENEGTFTLKLINPQTNDAVWVATGSDVVDENIDPEKRQKKVKKTIKKMFKKFPGEKEE